MISGACIALIVIVSLIIIYLVKWYRYQDFAEDKSNLSLLAKHRVAVAFTKNTKPETYQLAMEMNQLAGKLEISKDSYEIMVLHNQITQLYLEFLELEKIMDPLA